MQTHCCDHREIARQKKLLSSARGIRDALDEQYWPLIQPHRQISICLGPEAELKHAENINHRSVGRQISNVHDVRMLREAPIYRGGWG